MSPAYTVIDVARHFGPIAGLMVADAVMARGVEREVPARLTEQMERYPGMSTARWVVEHADPRAESPLETLGRMAFLSAGRPAPVSNVWFVANGRRFRVDHYLPESGVAIEGDGAGKFNNRADADVVVTNQVERERLLRLLGLGFVRYNYALALNQPRELLRRVDDEVTRVAPTFRSVPWFLERPVAGMKVVDL